MKSKPIPVEIYLPEMSDAAAVEVREFLGNLLLFFSSHYCGQIHSYYQEHDYNDLAQHRFFADPPDYGEEPF